MNILLFLYLEFTLCAEIFDIREVFDKWRLLFLLLHYGNFIFLFLCSVVFFDINSIFDNIASIVDFF